MKRFVISSIIMVVILVFVICWLSVLASYKEKLLTITKEASQAALDKNVELATVKYDELKKTWDEQEDILIVFVRHEHVDQISVGVAKLSSILTGDNLSEFISECSVIEEAAEHMWRSELPMSIEFFS